MRNSLFIAIGLMLLLCACSGTPSGVVKPNKMALILADLHEAEAFVDQNNGAYRSDSSRLVLKQSVYALHGVTPDEMDSSFAWYGRNIDKYTEVYDMAIAEIEKRLKRSQEEADNSTERTINTDFYVSSEGDSVEIWKDATLRNFSPVMSSQLLAFDFRSDNNWEPGDVYTLRYKLHNTVAGSVRATIVAEYPDGTITYSTTLSRSDQWHRLTLHLNAEKRAASIYGMITPEFDSKQARSESQIMIDSVSLVRQRVNAQGVGRQKQFSFRSR